MRRFLRLALAVLFTGGLIASLTIAETATDARVAPLAKSRSAAMPMATEVVEEAKAHLVWQPLPLEFASGVLANAENLHLAMNLDSHQNNRYRHRSDLHRLKQVFLI